MADQDGKYIEDIQLVVPDEGRKPEEQKGEELKGYEGKIPDQSHGPDDTSSATSKIGSKIFNLLPPIKTMNITLHKDDLVKGLEGRLPEPEDSIYKSIYDKDEVPEGAQEPGVGDNVTMSSKTQYDDINKRHIYFVESLLACILVAIIFLIAKQGTIGKSSYVNPPLPSPAIAKTQVLPSDPKPLSQTIKKDCTTPPPKMGKNGKIFNIQTGREPVGSNFAAYTSFVYRCNNGYKMSPVNSFVTCTENGNWTSKTAPNCTREYKKCDQSEHVNPSASGGIENLTIAAKQYTIYCDYISDGGGWIVFLRRIDGQENFIRSFNDYETGFGKLTEEFWIGLNKLHELTNTGEFELRIDMEDFEGHQRQATYSRFKVGPGPLYTLDVGGYTGDAGDSLQISNGSPFSTTDNDQDGSSTTNCAVEFQGAWWYDDCHHGNLCGKYLNGPHDSYGDGVNWRSWRGYHYSMKRAEMKIRSKS